MLEFIRKDSLFGWWDQNLGSEIHSGAGFHLKTVQDLAVYSLLREMQDKVIAEVGGGASRILPKLGGSNRCFNIEKFEGLSGGPSNEVHIPNVKNVRAYLGEFSPDLLADSFDAIFSVSVVEHVEDAALDMFLLDGLRLLRSGGLWAHAVDMYIGDIESPDSRRRFEAYKTWFSPNRLRPFGDVFRGSLVFSSSMASNPDDSMYSWNKIAPNLTPLRKTSQSVSLFLVGYKP